MPRRLPALLLAALLAAIPLAGCQQGATRQDAASAQNTAPARQAVQQQYDARTVDATVREQDGQSFLDVVLVNPSGREATNQQRARSVGSTARQAYDGALDTVRVSFEFSSRSGPAEVGFHRRYAFAPDELSDTTSAAAPRDTTAGTTR